MKKILLYLLGSFLWFVAVISAIVIWAKTEGDRILESTPPANAMEREQLDKSMNSPRLRDLYIQQGLSPNGDIFPKAEIWDSVKKK